MFNIKKALFLVTLLAIAVTEVQGQTVKLTSLQAGRYTRQGDNGVLVESGIMATATQTFEGVVPHLYPESALNISASTLTAINGKFVVFASTIDLYRKTIGASYVSNFTFSKATYDVVGGSSYIVNFASGEDTTAATASLKVSKTKLTEGSKSMSKSKIEVTLNKAATTDIVVRYKMTGTARYNSDYLVAGNQSVIKILKGKKSGAVTLSLVDNKLKEKTENLKITLLAGGQYKLGKKIKTTISILDND